MDIFTTTKGVAPLGRALSLVLSITLVCSSWGAPSAFADETGGSVAHDAAEPPVEAVEVDTDITDAWNAGSLVLDEGGTYVLSDDVRTDGTLTIAAPEGAVVEVDFRGHDVAVAGAVTAGIDASPSEGDVIIRGGEVPEGEERAELSVQVTKATDAACGILANYETDDEESAAADAPSPALEVRDLSVSVDVNTVDASSGMKAHDCYGVYVGYADEDDARTEVSVILDNCSFAARLNLIELDVNAAKDLLDAYGERVLDTDASGLAAGVFAEVPGVSFAGDFDVEAQSEGGACDLYGVAEESFSFSSSFDPQRTVRVYSAGNALHSAFGVVDAAETADADFASLFEDATENGYSCSLENRRLLFADRVEDDAVDGGSESEAPDPVQETTSTDAEEANDVTASVDAEDPSEEESESTESDVEKAASPEVSTMLSYGTVQSQLVSLAAASVGEAVCLNDEWEKIGTTNNFSLVAGTDYYLNEDLTITGNLMHDAGAGDVTLDLQGHELTFGGVSDTLSSGSAIRIGKATNSSTPMRLQIVSTTPSDSKGRINFVDVNSGHNITLLKSGALRLDNVEVTRWYSKANAVSDYSGAVIYVNALTTAASYRVQELSIINSSIKADYSNQTKTAADTKNQARAVYVFTRALNFITIDDSSIACALPANVKGAAGGYDVELEAYAVSIQARDGSGYQKNASMTVSGSSFTAEAESGSAYGIYFDPKYGPQTTFDGDATSIAIKAASNAIGIYGGDAKCEDNITLDSTLLFSSTGTAHYPAALSSDGARVFAIGQNFKGSNLPAMIGSSATSANADDAYIASYAPGFSPTEGERANLAASFVNAVGDLSFVNVVANEQGVLFEADIDNAVARVLPADGSEGKYYGTLDGAFKALKSGETIQLLKGADSLVFPIASEEQQRLDGAEEAYQEELAVKYWPAYEAHNAAISAYREAGSEYQENGDSDEYQRLFKEYLTACAAYEAAMEQCGQKIGYNKAPSSYPEDLRTPLAPEKPDKTEADLSGLSYAVDLNGQSIKSFVNESGASVTVAASTDQPTLQGTQFVEGATFHTAAIVQNGAGALTVEGLNISIRNASKESAGVWCAGKGSVALEGVTIAMNARTQDVHGVYFHSPGTLSVKDSSVSLVQYGGHAAYGLSLSDGKATLEDSSVAVRGIGSTMAAVQVMSGASFSASATSYDADRSALTVLVEDGAGAVTALGVSVDSDETSKEEDKARATISNYAVSVTAEEGFDTQGSTLACLRGTGGSVLGLAGSCSFVSAGDAQVSHSGAPLEIAPDFALSDGQDAVTVSSAKLAGDSVFATLPASAQEGASLASKASLFKIPAGSAYDGWDIEASDAGGLRYSLDACATVGDSSYTTLQAAIDAAGEGGTIVIQDDASSTGVSVDRALTIDLNGHTLSVACSQQSNNYWCGILVKGSGALTVIDTGSEGKGRLKLTGGSAGDAAAGSYAGICVRNSNVLALDGCEVQAVFAGSASASTATMTGVLVQRAVEKESEESEEGPFKNGRVELAHGATLAVHAKDSATLFSSLDPLAAGTGALATNYGALNAYGIEVMAARTPSTSDKVDPVDAVSVDADSSIRVVNPSIAVEQGKIVQGTAGAGLYDESALTELVLDESSAQYQEILTLFQQKAKYDYSYAGVNVSGTYDNNIYYAAPLELADGTLVWAFSKPVTGEHIGDPSYIKPEKLYIQTKYQQAPVAAGIVGSSLASRTLGDSVAVAGTVTARCANGDAYAVQAEGAGTWTMQGATLSADGGDQAYLGSTGSAPNLNEALGLNKPEVKFYPQNAGVKEAVETQPKAAAIVASDGKPSIVLDGAVSLHAKAGESAVIRADKVTIGANLSVGDKGDNVFSVADSSGASAIGGTFAVPSGTVRLTAAHRDMFADANGTLSPVVAEDENLLKWGGSYTVSFVNGYGQEVEQVKDVLNGQTVVLPDASGIKKNESDTATYTFVGWSTDPNATADSEGLIDPRRTTIEFAAPEGQSKVTYYAIFKEVPTTVTVTFRLAFDENGDKLGTVRAEVPTSQSLKESIANGANLAIPDAKSYTVGEGDEAMRSAFVGWAAVSAGTTIVYDPKTFEDFVPTSDTVFTAYYVDVAASEHLVTFKVDDKLSAQAVADGAIPSYKVAAGAQSESPTKANTNDGHTYQFMGWFDRWVASSDYKEDSVLAVSASEKLPAVTGDVFYTSCFKSTVTRVSFDFYFYQEDGAGTLTYKRYETSAGVAPQCEYGTDPLVLVKDKTKSFIQDGTVYEFLGWTTRYSDKEPLYTDALPLATGSAKYYAVYRDTEQTADVTFVVDGKQYAKADGQKASAHLQDVWTATGIADDPVRDDGTVFKGWSNDPNDTSGLALGTTYLKAYISLADATDLHSGQAVFYAIFGKADEAKVTLHYNNGGDPATGLFGASIGGTVKLPDGFQNPTLAGSYFNGWTVSEDGSGDAFDILRDAVDGDQDLYARYAPIVADVDGAPDASVDLSGTFIRADGAVGADTVSLQVDAAKSADANLAEKLGQFETALQAYSVRLGFVSGSETTYVTSGFGEIKVSLPVPDDHAGNVIKAYWLKTDGTVGSQTLSVDSGNASLSLTGYAVTSFGGNVVLASVMSEAEQSLALTKDSATKSLDDAFKGYFEGDYDADRWQALEDACNNGLQKVNEAKTAEEAATAANDAIAAMKAIPTTRGLASAKADGLERLATAYAGYTKTSYTDANWKSLVAAYEAARENVQNATTADAANTAATAGITAMNAVVAGGTSSSGGGLTTSSSGTGLASSSTGSNLKSSSSGSDLSSGDSSGAALASGSDENGGATKVGATLETLTSELVEQHGLKVESGVYVSAVSDDGPASKAGLQSGDVITKIDGEDVASVDDLERALSDKSAGDAVVLTVNRDGEELEFEIILDSATPLASKTMAALGGSGNDGLDANAGEAELTGWDAMADWVKNNLVAVCLAALAVLVAVAALVWWLLRRRNRAYLEEEDEAFHDDDDRGDGWSGDSADRSPSSSPAIQF